jgi:hypothetical protein
MQLTEEDKKRVLDWISAKCGGMRCTCCGLGNWGLNDHASIFLGVDVHTTRFFYHAGFQAVSLICANCGHVVFFNTGVIGFKPDQPPVNDIRDGLPVGAQSPSVTAQK